MRSRSDQRQQFLTDVLITAIESGSLGWFVVHEYRYDTVPLGAAYAVIEPEDDDAETYRVDLDVIARGLAVIRNAAPRPLPGCQDAAPVLCNATTGQRLYLSTDMRRRILAADRSNGDDGDLDAIDALDIVECALFGRVVYA